MIRRILAPLALLFALTGCILVEDFSPMWEKSKPDACLNKIAESLYYSEFRRDPNGKDTNEYAHAFTLGKHHFLMLKKNTEDKGGRMYRFGVVNGIFQRYRLDPVMRTAFEIGHPDAPVSFRHDTVTVENLSPEVISLLTEISDDSKYWEIEDQTLYNVMLNPLCRFEDRDLEALKEDKTDSPKKPKATKKKASQ
jgi:hypothetical protein